MPFCGVGVLVLVKTGTPIFTWKDCASVAQLPNRQVFLAERPPEALTGLYSHQGGDSTTRLVVRAQRKVLSMHEKQAKPRDVTQMLEICSALQRCARDGNCQGKLDSSLEPARAWMLELEAEVDHLPAGRK